MKTSLQGYDENSSKGYFLEGDVEYPKNLFYLHNYLLFLSEKKKIKKCNKLICNVYDKKNYVVYIRVLKQPLNHRFTFKKYIK